MTLKGDIKFIQNSEYAMQIIQRTKKMEKLKLIVDSGETAP